MQPPTPDSADFDIRLAEARRLRFSPDLERQYDHDTSPERSRVLVTRGYVGLLLFLAYLGMDFLLTPDVFQLAMALKTGLLLPLGLGVLEIVRRNPPVFWREGLPALVVVAGSALVAVVMLESQSPLREYHHYAFVLLMLFLVVILPIRFTIACVASAAVLAIDVLAFLLVPETRPVDVTVDLAILLSATLISLAGAFNVERNMRTAYLAGRRQTEQTAALEDLAHRDPLTGLGNRRVLDEILPKLAPDGGADLAAILADVDHFKAYNDSLGHQAGDLCLKRIAGHLASELRNESDSAIRFGGEEFLLLLPNTDLWTAIAIAERIRAAVETAAIPHPGRHPAPLVTVSLGVAAGRVAGENSAEDLIRAADAALYAAKNTGRNQVWPRPRSKPIAVPADRLTGAA